MHDPNELAAQRVAMGGQAQLRHQVLGLGRDGARAGHRLAEGRVQGGGGEDGSTDS